MTSSRLTSPRIHATSLRARARCLEEWLLEVSTAFLDTYDPARYVASEQVADLANAVFHEFVSLSIQHLVSEIGDTCLTDGRSWAR